MKTLEELFTEYITFGITTFEKATVLSSIEKLKKEIAELEDELKHPFRLDPAILEEYIDCIMCLIHSAGRYGFSVEQIRSMFERKLYINQNRKWKENPDKTYSHEK